MTQADQEGVPRRTIFRTGAAVGVNWLEAVRRVARAGWRAEVHSLTPTDFRTEIEAVDAELSIKDLRWVVAAHVPFVVVLDRDYFRVPEDEIRHVRSVPTVVGGSMVHDTGKVR